MKKIGPIFFLIFVIFLYAPSYGLISDLGFDPMDQTSGARPLGMGGAYNAISDDINTLFYNPAGLAYTKGLTLTVRDLKNFSLGAGYETGAGNFGIGLVYKGYEDFFNNKVKTTYDQNIALIGYAFKIEQVSIGVRLKNLIGQRMSVSEKSDLVSSGQTEADIGLIYKPLTFLSLGATLQNMLGSTYTIIGTKEAFPRSTKIGASLNILGKDSIIFNDMYGIMIAYDSQSLSGDDINTLNNYAGLELSYGKWLFLRFGSSSIFTIDKKAISSSFGIGYRFWENQLDFASCMDPFTESQVSYISFIFSPKEMMIFAPAKAAGKEEKPPKKIEEKKELLKVTFPEDEYKTYEDVIPISGEVRPGSTALINGVNLYIGADGKFSAMQQLMPGKNLIEIEARQDGDKKIISRKVLKRAKVVIAEEEGFRKKIGNEILFQEANIARKTEEIKTMKNMGVNVTEDEKKLNKEMEQLETRKKELYSEKTTLEGRKEKVENLITLGVIETSSQESFAIEAPITRGEMISWLVKAAEVPIQKVDVPVFSDVPVNHRYAPEIKAAFDAGLLKISGDRFRPDDPVTEEEGKNFFKAFGVIS